MPRVMCVRLRVDFHNFDHNFVVSRVLNHRVGLCVIGNVRTFGQIPRVIGIELRVNFDGVELGPSYEN